MPAISYKQVNRSAVVFLLLSLGLALGMTLAFVTPEHLEQKTIEQQTIEWLDKPRRLVNFSLESEAGAFDKQSLMGHWTIVFFGFLHCPDICPTSLSQLATLAASLAEKPIDKKVAFVFVSVDPERDSLVEISQYVRHFHSSILAVTGSEEQLTQFAKRLGIQFKVSSDNEDYTVAHSITFSIIDPEGVFRGRFSPGFDVSSLVRNFTSKLD
ncbi:MAG: SCO family protein [Spongiibacteraceae bacterium]|nr:SCO family protein [Spongiibacteraceae bacterium]